MSMEKSLRVSLTPSEWHVMEYLWAHGPSTGRETTQALAADMGWSRSTTLTLLRRMEAKGAVAGDDSAGVRRFRPTVGRDAAALQETEDFLDRVYRGSLSLMVSAMTRQQALSKSEIDELYALLREMEARESG